MSKKKFPQQMPNIVDNFDDLGAVLGIKKKPARPEVTRKCRRCGGELHRVAGTNVFICDGVNPETKVPYEHKVLSGKLAQPAIA